MTPTLTRRQMKINLCTLLYCVFNKLKRPHLYLKLCPAYEFIFVCPIVSSKNMTLTRKCE